MTHNLSDTRIYHIYHGIKQRCYNVENPNYYRYGGKGISICPKWVNDFQSFYDWSMENGYTDELTLDRIDSAKDYSPDNCQWITKSENSARVQNRKGTPETIAARKELKEKGKISKPSSKSVTAYIKKAYNRIEVKVPKPNGERFKKLCSDRGTNPNKLLNEWIEAYLNAGD